MSSEESNVGQNGAAPRRRHRFRRTVIILLLLLVGVAWSGPYLASTDMAREMIVSSINSRIYGTVLIDYISLSWLGPCRIKGLRVMDTSGLEVLHVEQIVWDHGAWRGIIAPENFGNVDVIEPDPKLIIGPDGKVSLAEALKLKKPSDKPLPELKGRITVRGGSAGVVLANGQSGELSGLDAQFDLHTLKDVAGGFSWESVEMYDLVLGRATFKPTFHNERLDLPVTTIPVSAPRQSSGQKAGCLRIGCEVDFSAPDPVLKVPGILQLAENIPIDHKLGSDLLSRILAIFYEPKKLTGQVSLTVENLNLPLGESIKRTGSGRGKLILKDVKIQDGGLIANLTTLGGLAPPTDLTPMKIGDFLFEIKDGRCWYDDLTVIFADTLDMKFSGSVGFDDTLDLIVSLPVLPRQMEKLAEVVSPAKIGSGIGLDKISPLLDNFPIIGSLRHIEIRIAGTRQKPLLGLPPILDPILRPETRPVPHPTTKPADPLFDLFDGLLKPKPAE